jgi:hypothetical protein
MAMPKREKMNMDRQGLTKASKGIGCFIVLVVVGFLLFGGWGWMFGAKPASKPTTAARRLATDPLGDLLAQYQACADGTIYMVTGDGKVFWLVGGKATAVECPEAIAFGFDSHSDMRGGLYVQGEEHLWYMYKGAAAQVKEVPRNEIPDEEHRVTTMSVNWAARQEVRGASEKKESGE